MFSAHAEPSQSPLAKKSKVKQMTFRGKMAFVFLLLIVGSISAYVAFFIMGREEAEMGEYHFEATAELATIMALHIMNRKRLGLVTLSSVISGANPDVSDWPLVQLSNFEVIANNLMRTADDYNMGFAPFVTPEQVTSFETHAYDFYEVNRSPEPFPQGTGQSPFGKGIYALDPNTNERYHDVTGETYWNSPNSILAPVLHHSRGPESSLLSNLHADQTIGHMIDAMMECSEQQKNLFVRNATMMSSLDNCTILSGMSPNSTGWTPYGSEEPWGLLIHPVYAQKSPETVSFVSS